MICDRKITAVTGANGFLGTNLLLRLKELDHDVRPITREMRSDEAARHLATASTVFHLAGLNRSNDERDFLRSNRDYTAWVAAAVADGGRKPVVIYSSSAKAGQDTPYGTSKLAGEQALLELASNGTATISIWRLPNICGKWCRPNYNSAVATFCHNVQRGLPLRIDDPAAPICLLHVDALIDQWLTLIADPPKESGYRQPQQTFRTTVGAVAALIQLFDECRSRGEVTEVANGLSRILYACYSSAIPITDTSHPLTAHSDSRGIFVEILKTASSGQFSYFSAHPGVTRGGHYHHSKVEKFLVAHGIARFRFRDARNGEQFELVSSAKEPLMIETIPGWAHDVTNIGDDELVVLTWANEPFDPNRPDTHPMPL